MATKTIDLEAQAALFMRAATHLGVALNALDELARAGHDICETERSAAEYVTDHGDRLGQAMKEIAMRLDRAALIKEMDRIEKKAERAEASR